MANWLRKTLLIVVVLVVLDLSRDLPDLASPDATATAPLEDSLDEGENEDGFPVFKRFIGSPNTTLIQFGDCQCEIVSIDCLDAIRCLPQDPLPSIHVGVVTRATIKKRAKYWTWPVSDIGGSPIGMTLQFVTIGVFREWLSTNKLPTGTYNSDESFANGTLYPCCRKHELYGRRCLFQKFGDEEVYGDIEQAAVEKYASKSEKVQQDAAYSLRSLQKNPFKATPLEYLLAYTHVSRIVFNLRTHTHAIYHERLKAIDHNNRGPPPRKEFRVAMHFRRGDSCQHETTGYEKTASSLHSQPQISMNRLCYDTSVYMDALQRVQQLVPDRHLVV